MPAPGQPAIPHGEPADLTVLSGTIVMLKVNATGIPPLVYQWRRFTNSTTSGVIPGATNDTLVLTNVAATLHRFAVVVTDSGGSTTSRLAAVSVLRTPTITPANPTASLFANLTLTGTATTTNTLTYQWLSNGVTLAAAVGRTLSLTNVQKSHAAEYALVVNYGFGAITSKVETLRITPFNALYCFGFSWTDTGGNGCTWPEPRYYGNRACNGPMWPEYLSKDLGLSYVYGNNYAHCGALAAETLAQVTSRLVVPSKPQLSLYCFWEGGSDMLKGYPPDGYGFGYIPFTNKVVWSNLVVDMIHSTSNTVDQLYRRGARSILIEKQWTWETQSDLETLGAEASHLQSTYLLQLIAGSTQAARSYMASHPDVRIYSVPTSKWDEFLAHPERQGFTNLEVSALGDPSLVDKSFTGPGANYYLWDDLHPTSRFHRILAQWHYEALTTATLEELIPTLEPGRHRIQMNHLLIGREYTLQRSTDLQAWSDLQTFTAPAGTNQVTQSASEEGSFFYRLEWKPWAN